MGKILRFLDKSYTTAGRQRVDSNQSKSYVDTASIPNGFCRGIFQKPQRWPAQTLNNHPYVAPISILSASHVSTGNSPIKFNNSVIQAIAIFQSFSRVPENQVPPLW